MRVEGVVENKKLGTVRWLTYCHLPSAMPGWVRRHSSWSLQGGEKERLCDLKSLSVGC